MLSRFDFTRIECRFRITGFLMYCTIEIEKPKGALDLGNSQNSYKYAALHSENSSIRLRQFPLSCFVILYCQLLEEFVTIPFVYTGLNEIIVNTRSLS